MENSRRLKQMVIYSLLFILIMISCYSCSAKGMEKHDENMELKLVETYSLVSTNVLTNFQTNGTISGVYLFGSGTTSGNTGSKYLPIYQYWYKRGDGGIVSGIIDYSEFSFPEKVTVVIFEDDKTPPKLEVWKNKEYDPKIEYRFTVPTGTVVNSFDLQGNSPQN